VLQPTLLVLRGTRSSTDRSSDVSGCLPVSCTQQVTWLTDAARLQIHVLSRRKEGSARALSRYIEHGKSSVNMTSHLDMLLNEPPLKDVAVLGRHRILWHAAGDCADKPSLDIGGPRLHDAPVAGHTLGETDERRHDMGEGGGRGEGAGLLDRYVLRAALAGGGRSHAQAWRGGGCPNICAAPVCSQVKDGAAGVALAQNMMARCAATCRRVRRRCALRAAYADQCGTGRRCQARP